MKLTAKGAKDIKFLFRMSDGLHKEVKIRAASRNISMGHWIAQAILERINKEELYEKEDKK